MTMQQTIEIPADRRVYFDFLAPQEIPIGTAEVAIIFNTAEPKSASHKRPFEGLFGCTKGSGVWDGDGVEIIRKLRDEW